jgi:arabinofuranosyltransferase
MPFRLRSTFAKVAAVMLLLSGYGVSAWVFKVGLVDDTYIFLRYARNIAEGHGAVFNIGERVEGYTSPLWLGVLALLAQLPLSLERAAFFAGGGVGALTVLLPVTRERHWGGIVGATFLATHLPFVVWAWSGMDTILTASLLLATVLAAEEGRYGAAGIWFSLAILARLDALWFVPAVASILLWKTSWTQMLRKGWQTAVPCAAVVSLELFWRHQYYGTWVPNTAIAKAGISSSFLLTHGLAYVGKLLFLYAPIWVLGIVVARDRGIRNRISPALIVPALSICWWLVYLAAIGGDHFAFGRFAMPAVCLGAILIARVAAPIVRNARDAAAAIALIIVLNGLWWLIPDRVAAQYETTQAEGWAETGQWLRSTQPAERSIATLVAGAIPFYSGMYTYDLLGLVDATVARQGSICQGAVIGHYRVASDYVLSRNPDLIIFPSSGLVNAPQYRDPASWGSLPKSTACSFMDLVNRPEVRRIYVYKAAQLKSGNWVEYLERPSDYRMH